jgi:hypothetical protein
MGTSEHGSCSDQHDYVDDITESVERRSDLLGRSAISAGWGYSVLHSLGEGSKFFAPDTTP